VSSDIQLKVSSAIGVHVEFTYWADVSLPFEQFVFYVDGEVENLETSPTGQWNTFTMHLSEGVHFLQWSVEAPSSETDIDRSSDVAQYGTGVVYMDDFQLHP
jgi:hypothetical protein